MSVAETLLSTTVVLIPLWLGIVRYLVHETDTENKLNSNITGIILVMLLIGILYSMTVSIIELVGEEPELQYGLYTVFIVLAVTGIGGVYIIVEEIDLGPIITKLLAVSLVLILVSVPGQILAQLIVGPFTSFAYETIPIKSILGSITSFLSVVVAFSIIEAIVDHYRSIE